MAGMMSGAKGMGAAKMRGKFPFKKKKKGAAKAEKAEKTELKGDEEVPSASEQEVPTPGKIRKRMVSETY